MGLGASSLCGIIDKYSALASVVSLTSRMRQCGSMCDCDGIAKPIRIIARRFSGIGICVVQGRLVFGV